VYPTHQIDIVQENLYELIGYMEGMCKAGQIPEHHQAAIREYIEKALQAIKIYDLEVRNDDDAAQEGE
jgi:hypothetical protein